ncbi:hypothetical protein K9O30_23000 [Clostridium bowmanii]|uniref:hypothetical protein n=1 Tax=Clostridium bowmanii TaxID=132925 RepID=UPI001C0C48B7|nr:hypothetical protein [Clostridium bowmanii]MBU3192300.1 hypothetical protein [Clostridium bowmanii]MCA1076518.1 hypothetical protein [Clostridium bowmanii]
MISKFLDRNGKVIVAIIVSIILCIAIPFILNRFVFTNGSKPNLTNLEWSTFLGSYIGGILGGTATLIAVIISLNISKKIQMESELRVNSLIVYYDLITGSNDLKRLYINSKNKEFKNIPSRMYFSKEWINNIAKISSEIRDTASLYKLYTDLEIISEELKIKNELQTQNSSDFDYDRYEKIIYKISNRIFNKTFLDSNMNKYNSIDDVFNVDEELNSDFKKIITDLKSIIH